MELLEDVRYMVVVYRYDDGRLSTVVASSEKSVELKHLVAEGRDVATSAWEEENIKLARERKGKETK